MNPAIATLVCFCGIAGLFYLDRDRSARPSKALWLPVLWVALVGSRPLSVWLGFAPADSNTQLAGSPFDAAIFGLLSLAAIAVLVHRGRRVSVLLFANWPIVLYFVYCLISVTWSFHPDIAVKRWIKATGDLWMVLVVITDREPTVAFNRLISRLGFVLLPISVLLIKYYGYLGRAYAPNGELMNTGVTTDKNMLGVTLLVISLGALWQVINLWKDKARPDRRRHLIAQVTLLGFGGDLLLTAHSSTSLACFLLGGGLVVATSLRAFQNRPGRVHVLCAAVLLAGAMTIWIGGVGTVAHALGRQSTLSGRTAIWAAVLPAAANPIVGSGFESFWISPDVVKFQSALVGWWHPELLNEAHNGYIEVYLNLGLIGVGLMATVLISGYARATKALRKNWSVAGLMIAYIMAAAIYSITEAGFRMLDPIWIFLLFAIISSTGIRIGFFNRKTTEVVALRAGQAAQRRFGAESNPPREPIYTLRHGRS